MAYYGVFLDLEDRPCTVVGGGEVAARKVDGLHRAGARVTVIAPEVCGALAAWVAKDLVSHVARTYRPGDLRGAALVIAATDDEACNRQVAAEADSSGALVNVVDAPALSSFIAPALLERGELQVAVTTAGAAPAYAARVRDRIAELVGPETADVLRLLRRVRERLRTSDRPPDERRRVLTSLAASDLAERLRRRDREGVERLLREVVGPEATLADLEGPSGEGAR